MKQFLSLFRFQLTLNPYVWFALIAFAMPIFIQLQHILPSSYHPSLSSVLSVQNLFMVGIVGLWALAPEMGQPRGFGGITSFSGSEFVLTRAVDRGVVYRARVAYLYFLVLLFPVLALLNACREPDLVVSEYDKAVQASCLHEIPHAVTQPNPINHRFPLILLPGGSVLVEEYHLANFVLIALAVQVLLLVLYPLKHRLVFFYVIFLGASLAPLFDNLSNLRSHQMPFTESLFLYFTGHQLLFWMITALAFIAGQLWSERRFIRQQY